MDGWMDGWMLIQIKEFGNTGLELSSIETFNNKPFIQVSKNEVITK